MAYSGDENANNSFTVQYAASCCGWPTWVENAPHVGSPYTTTITGLTPGTSYTVRMTYSDPDKVTKPYASPASLPMAMMSPIRRSATLYHNVG